MALPKKTPRGAYFFKVSGPRGIRKTGGKIWLTYEERLERIEMMKRTNNEKLNDRINNDIDHNNGIII